MKINNVFILFCVVYRPPCTLPLDLLFDKLQPLLLDFEHIIITGHMNFNIFSLSPSMTSFLDLIRSAHLTIVDRRPTFHLRLHCLWFLPGFIYHPPNRSHLRISQIPHPLHAWPRSHCNSIPNLDRPPPIKIIKARRLHNIDVETLDKLILNHISSSPTVEPVGPLPSLTPSTWIHLALPTSPTLAPWFTLPNLQPNQWRNLCPVASNLICFWHNSATQI